MQIERQNQQNKYAGSTKSRIFQEGRSSQTERVIEQMQIERQNQNTNTQEVQSLEYFRKGVKSN